MKYMFFKKIILLGAVLTIPFGLFGAGHPLSAAVQSVSVDDFFFSSPSSDRATVDAIEKNDSVTLSWKTNSASRCESYAKVMRQGIWTDQQLQGWTTRTQEFQTPIDAPSVSPKESARLYLKCHNDTDQTSVEKWVEVRLGEGQTTLPGQIGTTPGLRGIYYDTAGDPIARDEKGGDIVMMRIDPRVSFSWNNRPPTDLLSSTRFTAEWKGDLAPRKTGAYSFSLLSDQGGALWINDELIIEGDSLTLQEFFSTKTIFMEVGRTYHIRLKTRHSLPTAVARLSWIDPDGKKEIIPARHLTTDALPAPISQKSGNGARATYTQYLRFDTPSVHTIERTDPTFQLAIPSTFQEKGDFRFDTTWEATLRPRITDFYRFTTEADGMVELTVSGNDIEESIKTEGERFEKHQTQSVFLEAGKSYSLRMVYRQSKGIASARLLWSRAGNPIKESIPSSQLFSAPVAQNKAQRNGTGLIGTYFNGENFEQLSFRRTDKTVNFNWKSRSPKSGPVLSDHFSARWEGLVEAPTTDFYQFSSRVDDRIVLWIGGQKIFDTSRIRAGQTLYSVPILLRAGERYPIKIEYAEYISIAYVDLSWASSSGKRSIVPMQYLYPVSAPKTPGTGLRGDYYEGDNFETFKTRHPAEYIGFDWGSRSPDPLLPADNFSIRWTGWIEPLVTDTYTFTASTDDGVRLWISDKGKNSIPEGKPPLIDEWHETPLEEEHQGIKVLEAGHRYFIKMEYFELIGPSHAKLFWSRKGSGTKEIIPPTRLYPEPLPSSGSTLTNALSVWPGNGNGLRAEYFSDENLLSYQGPRIDSTINFIWGISAPLASFPVDHFSVRWTGWLEPQYSETYTFSVLADDGVRLWLGEKNQSEISQGTTPLIDDWRLTPTLSERRTTRFLEAGHKYFIKIEYFENVGPANIQLFWQSARQQKEIVPQSQLYSAPEPIGPPPGNGTGLRGRYYRGGNTAYDHALPYPAIERIDPSVNFSWSYGVPYYSITADNFSVRWEGYVQPQYDGDYTFYLGADDSARLWVEESQIYDDMPPLIDRGNDVFKEYSATKTLRRGQLYRVRVDYSEISGDARVRLSWSHTKLLKQIIPQSQLYPPGTPVLSPN
jgi:hypothetical protein